MQGGKPLTSMESEGNGEEGAVAENKLAPRVHRAAESSGGGPVDKQLSRRARETSRQ